MAQTDDFIWVVTSDQQPQQEEDPERGIKEIKQYRFPGDLLDIGSGTGFFMQLAKKSGYSVNGVELSEYAAQYAKKFVIIAFTNPVTCFFATMR